MSDFETWLGNQLDARLDDYEEGKSVGYDSGYQQGRADAINDVLKLGAHFWGLDGEFYIKVRDIYELRGEQND